MPRKLALVTGASTGIGLELARCAAKDGCDLVVAADEHEIENAAAVLRGHGVSVEAVRADLSTEEGVEALWAAVGARELDYLMANAGVTLGQALVDEDWPRVRTMINLNVLGTTLLLHRALPRMIVRGEGRVLITGSIAGFIPGSYQAVYNATKAYLDSLSVALRDEVKDSAVTVTCLMPGLTDTDAFERAGMDQDTPVGRTSLKADPAGVAEAGYEAMKAGRAGMTPGLVNKLIANFAGVLPDPLLARMNRWMSEPDQGAEKDGDAR